jgi:hypothetical protein
MVGALAGGGGTVEAMEQGVQTLKLMTARIAPKKAAEVSIL